MTTLVLLIFFVILSVVCIWLVIKLKKEKSINQINEKKYEGLSKNLESNISYAREIASGNFDASNASSEDDILGQSLQEMSHNLKAAAEEEKHRTWAMTGITKISEIIRTSNHNMESLANELISFLIQYLKANQGGIFVLDTTDKQDKFLVMKGCFAYERKKYLNKKIYINEGLLGQAVLENDTIYLTDVPNDYLTITSGLGEANPNAIIIVPLKTEETVVGALEIASFHRFKPFEIEFLEKASENIASSIVLSKNNDHTNQLLKESRELAEQLSQQEEEMRQNMEELQAAQEDLERKQSDMKKAEVELKESKNYLDTIIDSIPIPVYVKDRKHQVTLLNDAFSRFIGKDKDDMLHKNDFDIFTKEQAELFWKKDEDVFQSNKIHVDEEVITDNEGKLKTVLTYKYPFISEKGDFFMVATMVDITERVVLEQQLSKERYLMDALMKNTTDYIYFKDLESRFIKVSQNMARAFGKADVAELLGKSDFDFFTKDHAQPAFDQEMQIIRTEQPVIDIVEKETWEDGRETYASTTKMPLRDANGKIVGTFGTSRDITKSKSDEVELLRKEHLYRLLLQNSSEVNTILNEDGTIRYQTPAFFRISGLNESEVIGKSISELIKKEEAGKIKTALAEAKEQHQKKVPVTFHYRNNAGNWIPMDCIIQNLLDDDSVKGYIIYSQNVNFTLAS